MAKDGEYTAGTYYNPANWAMHSWLSEKHQWKTLHHTWCNNTWDPALFSASSSKWQKQNSVGVGRHVSASRHIRAADVREPRLPLGILNSGDTFSLAITIQNQNLRGKTPMVAQNDILQPRTERHQKPLAEPNHEKRVCSAILSHY